MASFANSSNNFGNERQLHNVLFTIRFVSLNVAPATEGLFFIIVCLFDLWFGCSLLMVSLGNNSDNYGKEHQQHLVMFAFKFV